MIKKIVNYTWDSFERDIHLLAIEILKDFTPDVIVCLVRGGAVPGVKLSHILDKRVEFFEKQEILYKGNWWTACKKADINILFIDEIVDSGKTIQEVYEYAKWMGYMPNQYKFASLIHFSDAIKAPDYSIYEINREQNDCWIVFPWEKSIPLILK